MTSDEMQIATVCGITTFFLPHRFRRNLSKMPIISQRIGAPSKLYAKRFPCGFNWDMWISRGQCVGSQCGAALMRRGSAIGAATIEAAKRADY
jgi:hypothetical protein